jgi:hypothetical protein
MFMLEINLINMNYEQISAFLGGTIGTLIIKGITDYFGKKREHNQLLQKIGYERKLQVGEAAIAFYSYYRYNTVNMRSGLQATINSIKLLNNVDDQGNTDLDDVQKSMQRVGNAISDMFGDKYYDILSMNLYFDFLDSKDYTGDNITAVFTAIGQARATMNDIEYYTTQASFADQHGNVDGFRYSHQHALDLLPAYQKQIESILVMLEKDVVNSSGVINSIKAQLKIY